VVDRERFLAKASEAGLMGVSDPSRRTRRPCAAPPDTDVNVSLIVGYRVVVDTLSTATQATELRPRPRSHRFRW
jgi:hypothetical protein